jgi:protein XRP2
MISPVAVAVFLAFLHGSSAARLPRQAECADVEKPVLFPDYTPLGDVVVKADMDTYETGNGSLTTMLIGVYDIYGFNPSTNIWQICDRLAEQGYRVVLPDFFHGEPWKREHYPYPTE